MIDDESSKKPLVSSIEPLEVLELEYQNNPGFLAKVKWLKQDAHFLGLRRFRGDGNCFYRAFGFTFLLTVLKMNDRPLHYFTVQHLESTLELLKQANMDSEIANDFYEPLRELMGMMHSTDPTVKALTEDALMQAFNDEEKSNSIVVYLRLLTSAYLKVSVSYASVSNDQANADEYAPFLVGSDGQGESSMDRFCAEEVEALGKDADHVQITALCNALKVSLDVVYLSSAHAPPPSEQSALGEKTVQQDNDGKAKDTKESVTACDVVRFDLEQGQMFGVGPLLYRPGHYDLLVSQSEPESPEIDIRDS